MMMVEAATATSAHVTALITHGTMEADRSMAQWAFCALWVAVLRFVVASAMALLAVSNGPISSAWMRAPMLRATAWLSNDRRERFGRNPHTRLVNYKLN